MSTELVRVFHRRPPFLTVSPASSVAWRFSDGCLMAGTHGPVFAAVSVHDEYHLRTRHVWKRLAAERQDLESVDGYKEWADAERDWYRSHGVEEPYPPRRTYEKRQPRRCCKRGHLRVPGNTRRTRLGRTQCVVCERLTRRR